MPRRPAISLSAAAISSAWARLSSAHGPAIRASGSALPKRAAPIATTALADGLLPAAADWCGGVRPVSFMRPDHAAAAARGQCGLRRDEAQPLGVRIRPSY